MDLVVNELLLNCLDEAKIVFKKGLSGVLKLENKYKKIIIKKGAAISNTYMKKLKGEDLIWQKS